MPQELHTPPEIMQQQVHLNGHDAISLQEEASKLELRSDDVQDILSYVPHWLIRWGITLLFLLIIGVMCISWIVKYPDVIQGKLVLTTSQPPIKVVCKASGIIDHLYAENAQWACEGDALAIIESPVSMESVTFLRAYIEVAKVAVENPTDATLFPVHQDFPLGEMQTDYNLLVKTFNEYQVLTTDRHYFETIRTLSQQISYYKKLQTITEAQLVLSKEDLENAKNKFDTQSTLYQEGVISKIEYFKQSESYTSKQQSLENDRKTLVINQITISEKEKQLADLKYNYREKERKYHETIIQSIRSVENYLNNWQQSFVITAPVEGHISFLEKLSEKEYVETGEELFAIVPPDRDFLGIVHRPAQGMGKIALGQKVLIRLDNFPHHEYGQIQGVVQEIAVLPNKNFYRIGVGLPNGLLTNYHRTLNYQPEMEGIADIITENLRLTDRVFYRFRQMFSRKDPRKEKAYQKQNENENK